MTKLEKERLQQDTANNQKAAITPDTIRRNLEEFALAQGISPEEAANMILFEKLRPNQSSPRKVRSDNLQKGREIQKVVEDRRGMSGEAGVKSAIRILVQIAIRVIEERHAAEEKAAAEAARAPEGATAKEKTDD